MKKLNKKGFTLVELLAVIVILAVIMVITIPTVLGSMGEAKQSAFESALKTIEEYAEKNIAICKAGISEYTGTHDSSFMKTGKCELDTTKASDLVSAAGYGTNISIGNSGISESNGKVTISSATGAGEFNGLSYPKAS